MSHGGYQGTCWVPFQGYRRPCFHRVGKGMSLHQIPYQVHFHIDRSLRSETVRQGTVTTYKGNFSGFPWIINYYCSASHFCFGCIPFSQSCLRSSHCCAFIFLSQLGITPLVPHCLIYPAVPPPDCPPPLLVGLPRPLVLCLSLPPPVWSSLPCALPFCASVLV